MSQLHNRTVREALVLCRHQGLSRSTRIEPVAHVRFQQGLLGTQLRPEGGVGLATQSV